MPSATVSRRPASDDSTLEGDTACVDAALSATAAAFGVELSNEDQLAKTAKPLR